MIPHAPATSIRTRAGELARALAAQGLNVDLYSRNLQPRGISLPRKLRWHVQELLTLPRIREIEPGLRTITPPTAHRGGRLASRVDSLSSEWLAHLGYDAVVNAAYGGIHSPPSPKLIYDLVDDHPAGLRDAGHPQAAEIADAYVRRQMSSANEIIASSLVLVDHAKKTYGRDAHFIPNGADVARIRSVSRAPRTETKGLRVGYAGGLDEFVRIDVLVAAVDSVRRSGWNATLTIVGKGPAVEDRAFPSWVTLAGFQAPDAIPGYLATFDVGVVPFTLSPFTHAALPLKVVEYGAARTLCLSSPLQELQRHSFPWVKLVELSPVHWERALLELAETRWQDEWDLQVDRFDWKISAEALRRLL